MIISSLHNNHGEEHFVKIMADLVTQVEGASHKAVVLSNSDDEFLSATVEQDEILTTQIVVQNFN